MKYLHFKNFMKNYNLKDDTMNRIDLQKIFILYIPEILKFLQIKDLSV